MNLASWIFHPLLMATYLSSLLFYKAPELFSGIPQDSIPSIILVVFLTTGLIPALSIYMLKVFKLVSDVELSSRRERFYPFMIIILCYGVASYLFGMKLPMGAAFVTIIVGVSFLIFLLLIITNWIKISIHATAIWSGAGYISALTIVKGIDVGGYLYFLFVAAGITATSRLYLGYHKPKEIWMGTIIGFCYSFVAIWLFV